MNEYLIEVTGYLNIKADTKTEAYTKVNEEYSHLDIYDDYSLNIKKVVSDVYVPRTEEDEKYRVEQYHEALLEADNRTQHMED